MAKHPDDKEDWSAKCPECAPADTNAAGVRCYVKGPHKVHYAWKKGKQTRWGKRVDEPAPK